MAKGINTTKANVRLRVGFDTTVKAKGDGQGNHKKDEDTQLPLWAFKADVKVGESLILSGATVNVASAVPPVVTEETTYTVNGDLYLFPYASQSGFGVSYSITLVGSIAPVKAGFPAPKND
jgi:hypothetical protein